MNNTFNISRFGKYFTYDLASRWKESRIFFLVLALLPIIYYVFYVFFYGVIHGFQATILSDQPFARPALGLRVAEFVVAVFIFVIAFPPSAYGFITDKAKGSEWLMLPASRLEKFLSMALITLIIAPVVFFCAYLLCDGILCLIDPHCGQSIFAAWTSGWDPRNMIDINGRDSSFDIALGGNGIWLAIVNVLEYLAIFLLGALLFKNKKALKTIFALFVIYVVFSALLGTVISTMGVETFGAKVSGWVADHADHLDLWINFWGNFSLALLIAGCGVWSWCRIKHIQH